ncbi:LysR family transcriptional regulator [Undibacterium sp. SXout20W]|uniref:LysR family transcriptional regulator n=1 Tax=Undibacterium sp. SXout20W TaxID=3413051 RepID=UPI003BF2F650
MRINNQLEHLADMAVFANVVNCGSFSAAARRMGVSPSSVSRQVGRLESVLQIRLLERTTRKLRLTDAGTVAYSRCQDMLASAREVFALSDTHTAMPRGTVRVSMPKAVGFQLIHPHMSDFLQKYPDVNVQMMVTDRNVDLFEEAIDLAIRVTDSPPIGLTGRTLMQIKHLICASPLYLDKYGIPSHPRDLAHHQCLYLSDDERHCQWRFARSGEVHNVKVSGRYAANHSEIRLQGALSHLGVASLPEFTARRAIQNGELQLLLPDWEHQSHQGGTVWLLYPSNRFLPSKLRVLIDYLVQKLH